MNGRSATENKAEPKDYQGLRKKKEPTKVDALFATHGVDSYLEFMGRKAQLEIFLSRPCFRELEKLEPTPWLKAYSEFGTFGRRPIIRQETQALASAQKPHVIDHLRVMDQIKNRSNR